MAAPAILVFAFIVAAGWYLPKLLAAFVPFQRKDRLQLRLSDVVWATLVYGAIMARVASGMDSKYDFENRMPMFAFVILILQSLAFWIIEDVMCSMQPAPGVLKRLVLLAGFQIAFLYGFLILFPGWLRWRSLQD